LQCNDAFHGLKGQLATTKVAEKFIYRGMTSLCNQSCHAYIAAYEWWEEAGRVRGDEVRQDVVLAF
jgi:hypothetical protein